MSIIVKAARALGATGLVLLATASLAPASIADASLPTAPKCKPLMVDVRAGTVNGLGPATPLAKIKKRLPCFTGETDEGAFYNYGGGVFYGGHNLYFYTYLRFIEIREPFNGSMEPQVFGRPKAALANDFKFDAKSGRPMWAAPADEFVTTPSGCVQFMFEGDRMTQMRFFTRACGVVYQPAG